jgi:outer membrane receptor for ferrienterochelin and colicins
LAQLYGDKAFVSIATGTRQPIYRAPSTATVITAEDIEASGAVDLDEVLETVPGVHVSLNFLNNSNYGFRGDRGTFNNPHVLMLLNGIPVTRLFFGDRGRFTGWNGLPLENIQRIEVVRGPGSALYGSDAFSGVINIITKTAANIDGTTLGARAGSFDTYSSWWQHGGKIGDIAVAAYLRAGKTRRFKEVVRADAQTSSDLLMGTSASLAPGPVSTGHEALDGHLDLEYGKWRFRADYKGRYRMGVGVGVLFALDPAGYTYDRRFITDLTYDNAEFARDWSLSAQISWMHANDFGHLVALPPGTPGKFPQGMIGEPALWEKHTRFEVNGVYTGLRGHRVRLGAGAVSQRFTRCANRETSSSALRRASSWWISASSST